MKLVLCVRSNVAYSLLCKLIEHDKTLLPGIDVHNRVITNKLDLEDAIEFYSAELYIVDHQLEEAESLIQVLQNLELDFITIKADVKEVMPTLREKYGIEEEGNEIHYELEEKERVVVQEKIIEKEVIRTQYQAIPSKVVVVGSLYPGVGSTLLATNLARMVGIREIDVSYIEHPLVKPYMFDYLQIQERQYTDTSREIQEEGLYRSKAEGWLKDGVKWHVIDSRKPPLTSFTFENLLVLSHSIQSNVIIVDISNRWLDPEIQRFLYLADTILMCVEPNPIKYERSLLNIPNYRHDERKIMDLLNNTKELNKYELVLMKDGNGMDAKVIREMLHKRPIASVPYIPYQDVLKALYNIELLYDFENNAQIFEKILLPVISKFMPYEFLGLTQQKQGFFKSFFSKT
jgi:hypothetical protein